MNVFDPTGLYQVCGDDPSWGYICFDSQQVGLPADPPESCEAFGICIYPGGNLYATGGAENIKIGNIIDLAPPVPPTPPPPLPATSTKKCGFLGSRCAWSKVSDFLADSCNSAAVNIGTTAASAAPFTDMISTPINGASTAAAWEHGDWVGAAFSGIATGGSAVSLTLDSTIVGIPAGVVVGAATGAPSLAYSFVACVL